MHSRKDNPMKHLHIVPIRPSRYDDDACRSAHGGKCLPEFLHFFTWGLHPLGRMILMRRALPGAVV